MVARHLRMTDADKARKVRKQRERRLINPGVNGNLRGILGDQDYVILYNQIMEYQGHCCAICGKTDNGGRRFHMDHCHTTGVIRGLLCYSCNTKLGFIEKFLLKIADYLTKEITW